MKQTNLALFGHIVHTPNKNELTIYENSWLICQDGKVEGIYTELPERFSDFPIEKYPDKLIVPGMVDLHIHAPQYAFRGLGMDSELLQWLNEQAFPEEAKYADLEYATKAYSIFADAMKKSATTRACIFATRHCDATKLLMSLMENTGLVSYVGKVNMDRESPESLVEDTAEISAFSTFRWLNSIDGCYERTMPILTPRFIPACSDYLLNELREIQLAYNIPVQSHLSESPEEVEWVRSLRPDAKFYGDAYDVYDLFGERKEVSEGAKTIMAHCVWSAEEEVQRMLQNGVFVAHCPASNSNLSSGIAPIRKYVEKGLKIGLGSDVAGGQTESIFRAMVDAIQVSKLYMRHIDASKKPLTFPEVFYMATKGGGEFFGNVGSFEKDFEFDAIVLDDSALLHPQPMNVAQRLERAVYLSLDTTGLVAKYVRGEKIF